MVKTTNVEPAHLRDEIEWGTTGAQQAEEQVLATHVLLDRMRFDDAPQVRKPGR